MKVYVELEFDVDVDTWLAFEGSREEPPRQEGFEINSIELDGKEIINDISDDTMDLFKIAVDWELTH